MRTTSSPLSFAFACLTIALLAAGGCGGVDEAGSVFLIDDGTLVQVDGNTRWHGKAASFAELVAYFFAGMIIEVEAEGEELAGGAQLADKVDVLDLQELRVRGLVTDLDPVAQTFIIDGTTLVLVAGNTEWRGKASSFGELAAAFAAGMIIEVEAEGYELRDDVEGDLLASKVDVLNFAEARVRGHVTAVDRTAGTFVVDGTTVIAVHSQTSWHGQLGSFTALADQFDAGKIIEVEGAGLIGGGVLADKVDVLKVE